MYNVNASDNDWNKVEETLGHAQHKHTSSMRHLQANKLSGLHKLSHLILYHKAFELTVGAAIFSNLFLVIIETDSVARTGAASAPQWVNVFSWLILVIFIIEMLLRLYVGRCTFWKDGYNVFDFFLVVIDTALNIVGQATKMSISFLRIVRLCRLVRSIKAISMFPELRTLLAGLNSSLKPIFWGSMLLVFTLLVFAILAVQFIHPIATELYDEGVFDCGRGNRAYSSVFHAFLTLTQHFIMGDSWGCVSIPIIERSPVCAIFYSCVLVIVVMLVLNLILGVVVDAASQARNAMLGEMQDEKLLERLEVHSHLLEICKSLDCDDTGELTKEEVLAGYEENEAFRTALNYMDVSNEDLDVLWTCLDTDKSGAVTYAEFVASCYKMKSSNTHFLLAHIKYYVTVIKNSLIEQLDMMNNSILSEEKKLASELMSEERKIENTLAVGQQVLTEQKKLESNLGDLANRDKFLMPEAKLQANGESPQGAFSGPGSLAAESDENSKFVSKITQELQQFLANKRYAQALQQKAQSNGSATEQGNPFGVEVREGANDVQTCIDLLRNSNQQKVELKTTMENLIHKLDGTRQTSSKSDQRLMDAWQLPAPGFCSVSRATNGSTLGR